jgi:hypothetical protein
LGKNKLSFEMIWISKLKCVWNIFKNVYITAILLHFSWVISDFHHEVDENRALLGYSVTRFGTLRMGPIGCPETSTRNCHHSLTYNPLNIFHILFAL